MPVLGSLSYPEFSFSGGSRFQAGHLESKDEDRNRIAVSNEDDLAKHAGEDVPAYATGYKGDLIKGVMEQDQLFSVIIESLEL